MTERYPETEPYASGLLAVGDGHEIHWETVGDPTGVPAVYLHGGPGSGCGPGHRRNFDPAAYRAVLFDQRGCGRSRPLADSAAADLRTNTTGHLLTDIERLREHLGVERWVVVGGSWGVTLALAYAQRQPDRVAAMVLAAVRSGTRRETDWITREMRRVFRREWDAFAAGVSPGERGGDLAAAYARLLAGDGPCGLVITGHRSSRPHNPAGHRTSKMFRGTFSETSRSATPPKNSQAATCAATHEDWSKLSTGRTNMCRQQASTITNACTRRSRPPTGSTQLPR